MNIKMRGMARQPCFKLGGAAGTFALFNFLELAKFMLKKVVLCWCLALET